MAALLASAVISIYSRCTARLSLSQVILGSYVFIVTNVIIFWILIIFYDFSWVLYAFYMWSAIVGLVAVAQFWTLANDMFNPREGKRLFGILTAAGTLGAMTGGFGASLAVSFLFSTKQLLWLIVVLFAGAFPREAFMVQRLKLSVSAGWSPAVASRGQCRSAAQAAPGTTTKFPSALQPNNYYLCGQCDALGRERPDV